MIRAGFRIFPRGTWIHLWGGGQGRILRGGPQIVTGLKLPFWGLNFVEFWCWGLIFGDQGGARAPGAPPWIRPWGFWPPTWALFSENVCENERIGSCRGACTGTPPRSAYDDGSFTPPPNPSPKGGRRPGPPAPLTTALKFLFVK